MTDNPNNSVEVPTTTTTACSGTVCSGGGGDSGGNPKKRKRDFDMEEGNGASRKRKREDQDPIPLSETTTRAMPPYHKRYKKQPIPITVKRLVWNKHIGEYRGKGLCFCCRVTEISQMNFSCGHVIAECHGGQLTIPNLRPICHNCNSCMGPTNMFDFIEKHQLHA